MRGPVHGELSRRERQIMDAIYRLGEGSVQDIVKRMPEGASYGSVRVTLRILESKGYVTHRSEGRRYIYSPVVAADAARESALGHITRTFFSGSSRHAVLTLLQMSEGALSEEDLDEIASWIEQARDPDEEG